jgi:hypothetical protein
MFLMLARFPLSLAFISNQLHNSCVSFESLAEAQEQLGRQGKATGKFRVVESGTCE